MQAKFCKQPILSQILGVLSPRAEIVFLDFRQSEAVFGKTNYTTFVHLVNAYLKTKYERNQNFDPGRGLTKFCGHLLLYTWVSFPRTQRSDPARA